MAASADAADAPPAAARPRVVLGVGGGIAAYKVCELLRRLTESGHEVRVVPTASALHFVGAPTCTHLNDVFRSLADVRALWWASGAASAVTAG